LPRCSAQRILMGLINEGDNATAVLRPRRVLKTLMDVAGMVTHGAHAYSRY
jgi:hypothetical protein